MRMDLRWAGDHNNRIQVLAQEFATRHHPFAAVGDPVASGIVPRLNQPGGNVTGFAASKALWEPSGLSCSRKSRPA
jgi:hypothetical protein